jgi:two-component system sensor histidine kinase BaeS
MTTTHSPSSTGLATRLLAGQAIVLVAGALTVGLVAAVIGPPIFHQHLLEAGHQQNSPELVHIEMAYRDSSLISVGIGLLISLLAAGAVTWFLTRRLRRPLEQVTHAARELTMGHYAIRVPAIAAGTELETLAAAFNTMAARLDSVEDTRRRMLSDLAHELRTPIATISAYHEGLHDGVTSLGPESRAALEEQTQRLARLADDIDEVSTAEEGRLALDLRSHHVSPTCSGTPTKASATGTPTKGVNPPRRRPISGRTPPSTGGQKPHRTGPDQPPEQRPTPHPGWRHRDHLGRQRPRPRQHHRQRQR